MEKRRGTAFKLQKAERGAGVLMRGVEGLPYDERARSLCLSALEEGLLRAPAAKVYKVTNSTERMGLVNGPLSPQTQTTHARR